MSKNRIQRFGLFFLLLLAATVFGQKAVQPKAEDTIDASGENSYRLDGRFPTVYIAVEQIQNGSNNRSRLADPRIWFRLHNNTHWNIYLNGESATDPADDLTPDSELLDSKGKAISKDYCHVCTTNPLSPGGSVVFSLPIRLLVEGEYIRIPFVYEWESAGKSNGFRGNEPLHFVSFRHAGLEEIRKVRPSDRIMHPMKDVQPR